MLLIFVDEVTDRLIFTLDFIFKDRKVAYQFTNDPVYFEKAGENKFNYSNRYFEHIHGLPPATVIFDEAIFPYSIEKSMFGKEPCLSFDSITDPIAAIFYVLSRMEEYNIERRDEHERFPAKESILHKFGWLQKAVCDRWAEALIRSVEEMLGAQLHAQQIPSNIVPTFDIDNTFAFQWKHGWRRILGSIKDYVRRDHARIRSRKLVLAGKAKDPYDTFDYILSIAKRGFDVRLFWLLGDYAKYDKNISGMDQRHREMIRKLSETVKIGLHPSYKSNSANYYLENEKERIDFILGEAVTFSRQHFLKLQIPLTYQNLVKKEFTDDFTMGYADEVGFRAGTARPFRFFDLSKNICTEYMIHPFVYMDGTLHEYKHWTIAQSKAEIAALYHEITTYGGDFICIWHNETIGDFAKWEGWSQVLEFTLKLRPQNEIKA